MCGTVGCSAPKLNLDILWEYEGKGIWTTGLEEQRVAKFENQDIVEHPLTLTYLTYQLFRSFPPMIPRCPSWDPGWNIEGGKLNPVTAQAWQQRQRQRHRNAVETALATAVTTAGIQPCPMASKACACEGLANPL